MDNSKYLGRTCPYCKNEFNLSDNIVVCSACGTPHHANCWAENQGCTTFDCQGIIRGSEKESFHKPAAEKKTTVTCTSCGSQHPAGTTFCTNCGNLMAAPQTPAQETVNCNTYIPPVAEENANRPASSNQNYFGGEAPSGDLDSTLVGMVGPKSEYYIPKFQELKSQNKQISWNWCACLFGAFWMFYRKMYVFGAAYMVLNLIFSNMGDFGNLLTIAAWVASGVLGNWLYLLHLEKVIARANASGNKEAELKKFRGVSWVAAIGIPFAVGFVLSLLGSLF